MYVLFMYIDHIPTSNARHLTIAEVQNMMVKSRATEAAIIHQ